MFSEKKIYPSIDPKEAVSNMLPSLRLRIANSVVWLARKVSWDPLMKLDPVLARLFLPSAAFFLAAMDAFYNTVWLSVNTVVYCARGGVRMMTRNRYGHFCEELQSDVLKKHLYKSAAFFSATVAAPVVTLYSPEKVIEAYKQRELIIGKDTKGIVKYALEKLKNGAEYTLDKVTDMGEVILRKVDENRVAVTLTAVGAATAAAFTLKKIQ